jgi:uncharacterized protein YbjQ (UPF0145 family)
VQSFLDSLNLIVFLAVIAVGYVVGRRNERAHLRDLARREQELREITTFATRYPPLTGGALDPVLVSGSAVIAADSFKMFVAGLRKLVGGRFTAYENLVARTRREALLRMKAQARAAGCSMIFNVRVETTNIMSGNRGGSTAVEVFAYGTAFAPGAADVGASAHRYVPGPSFAVAEAFDLMKHRTTRWLLLGLLVATLYSFMEMVGLCDYWYVDDAPWPLFWLAGAAAAGALWRRLRRDKVPPAESIGLSLVFALALPPLLFFPVLRLNTGTDFSPPTETVYVLDERGRLMPQQGDHPELHFDYPDYWRAQETGSEHTFVLRRGLLGFWAVAREPYVSRVTAFEEEQRRLRERQAPASGDGAPRPPTDPAPAPGIGSPPVALPAAGVS